MAILELYVQRRSIATSATNQPNSLRRRRKFKKVKKRQECSTSKKTQTKSGSEHYADISASDKYSLQLSERTIKNMAKNPEFKESSKNLLKIYSNKQIKQKNLDESCESITNKNLDVLKYITTTKANFNVEPVQKDPLNPKRKGALGKVTSADTIKTRRGSRTSSRLSKKSKRSILSKKSIASKRSIGSKKSIGSKRSGLSNMSVTTTSVGDRRQKGIKLRSDEVEKPIVPTYQLSNSKYVREGWTKLRQPNFKITEKLFTFHTSLSHKFMNAFQKRNGIYTSYYDSNQLAALFQEEGGSFVYYPNGEMAISITEGRIGPRLVVYSMTKTNENGVFMPSQPMAIFDKNGNGVVYGYDGEIRLNYDQAEGALYDTNSHQPIHWMWKINEYLKQRRADLDGVNPDPNDDILPMTGLERKTGGKKKSRGKKSRHSRKSNKSRKSRKSQKSRKRSLVMSGKNAPLRKKMSPSEDFSSGEMLSVEIKDKKEKLPKRKNKKKKKPKRGKTKKAKKVEKNEKSPSQDKDLSDKEVEKPKKAKNRKLTKMIGKDRERQVDDDDDDEVSLERANRSTLGRRKKGIKKKPSSIKKHKKSSHRTRDSHKSRKHRYKSRKARGSAMRDLPPLRDPPLKPAPIVEIRPIAMKITDHISLRIMDQSHIHVDFFYYPKHFRFHVGINVHPELLVRIDKVIDPQPVTNIVPCYFELMFKRSSSLYNLHSIMSGIKKQAFKHRKMVTLKKCRLMGYKYDIIRRRRQTKGGSL